MLKIFFIIVFVFSFSNPVCSQTTTIEIPLTDLLGPYVFVYEIHGTVKTAMISVDADIEEILFAQFRVAGVADPGVLQDCSTGELEPWGLMMSLYISDESTGGSWSDYLFTSQEGKFESSSHFGFQYYPFEDQDTATLNFLLEGEHEISLRMSHRGHNYGQCPYIYSEGMDLSAASLVLTIPDTTPTTTSSWGDVKALFR